MAVFTPNLDKSTGILKDLADSDALQFGLDNSAHDEFDTPVAAFTFYTADGSPTDYPTVYIRMTSSFETAISNSFRTEQGIFGQPQPGAGNTGTITDAIGTLGGSFMEGLIKQVMGGAGAAGGFIASAGASGKAQVEFLRRQMFNNFSQLIYNGPDFRRFPFNFNFRPTSEDDAKHMISIIKLFKYASSPRTTSDIELSGKDYEIRKNDEGVESVNESEFNLDRSFLSDSFFLFGYPDMCKFDIMYLTGDTDKTYEQETVFSSKLCVIENVSATYGSQNKMSFIPSSTGNTYYPSEVNFQLQLKEAILSTAHDYGSLNTNITTII